MHSIYLLLSCLAVWFPTEKVLCFEAGGYSNQEDYTHKNITRGALDKAAAYYIANILDPDHYDIYNQTTDEILKQYFSKDKDAERRYTDAGDDIFKGIDRAYKNKHVSAEITMNNEMVEEGVRYLYYSKMTNIDVLSKQTYDSWPLIRILIGELLFTLQDFYSNTNWIEMGKGVLHDLGWKNTIDFPFARPGQPTCSSCSLINGTSNGTCHGNLLVNNVLTSGYIDWSSGSNVKPYDQHWAQGQGKCSHGGKDDGSRFLPATGGINKESASPLKSPHYYLHSQAGKVATNATTDFFIRNESSLLTKLGYIRFGKLIGLEPQQSKQCVHCNDPSVSMAFVIDTTNSMADDIYQTRKYAVEVVTKSQFPGFTPANYILVTFNDPANETTYQDTENGEIMKSWLNNLTVHGGGDCPEYSMSGLIRAMEYARPGSCVFFFSDADPKDPELKPDVLAYMESKNLHLALIITNNCDLNLTHSASHISFTGSGDSVNGIGCILDTRKRSRRSAGDIYKNLGGTYIPVPDRDITKALATLLEKNMDIVYANIFNELLSDGNLEILVDSRITAFTVEIAGALTIPIASLLRPDGTVETFAGKSSLNDIGRSTYIMSIVNPMPGKWILRNKNKTSWRVSVKQQGDIEFTAKLLMQIGESLIEVAENPITGTKLKLMVRVSDLKSTDTLTTGIILDENRQEIMRTDLTISDEGRQRIGTGNITVPNIPFRVAIEGVESSHPYRRESRHLFNPSSATLEIATLEDTLNAGKDNEVKCIVTNHGLTSETFILSISDFTGLLHTTKLVTVTSGGSASGTFIINPKTDSLNSMILTIDLMLHGTKLQQLQKVFMIQQAPPPTIHITGDIPSCNPSSLNYFNCSMEDWTIPLVVSTSSALKDIYTKPPVHIDMRNGSFNYSVTLTGTCCQPTYILIVLDEHQNKEMPFDLTNGKPFSNEIPIVHTGLESDIQMRRETGQTSNIYYALGGALTATFFIVFIIVVVIKCKEYSKVTYTVKYSERHDGLKTNGKPRMPKSYLQQVLRK